MDDDDIDDAACDDDDVDGGEDGDDAGDEGDGDEGSGDDVDVHDMHVDTTSADVSKVSSADVEALANISKSVDLAKYVMMKFT